MKSAVAELIGEFFAQGGEITHCPPGIGLGEPALKPWQRVGAVRKLTERNRQNAGAVLTALRAAAAPLTTLGLEVVTGLPITSLRGALTLLEREGRISATGQRPRFYRIEPANTDTGLVTGGPAPASAVAACVGPLASAAARPGKAA